MDIREKVKGYLKERFGPDTQLVSLEERGRGTHGRAYILKFENAHGERRLILKTLFPSEFGHDHYSDRAQVLLLANANYNVLPKHIKSLDVMGESPDRLISVKDAGEFYILMEEARGESYFKDLDKILERKALTKVDEERARKLAHYLADIHSLKYSQANRKILYRRRIRELIGHGECILGIIDTYDDLPYTNDKELMEFASRCFSWWGRTRNRKERLCRVHGDYHPGNIWFEGNDFALLDRSRGSWGEPADDLSCLAVNYIYYALKDTGGFNGPFSALFRLFWETYLRRTLDEEILEVVQPFFAFRILVLANPRFYPGDADIIKRKLFDFGHAVLGTERFEVEKVPTYLSYRYGH